MTMTPDRGPLAPRVGNRGPRQDRATISALIIVRDMADDLNRCLDSLDWVDETVVVVDAASRDRSEAVARARASKVIVRVFDDFASQRNAGLALATGDWVLSLDADERCTAELADEIQAILSRPDPSHVGFKVPIKSVIFNRRFRFSGTQGDRPLRLFQRQVGRWIGAVHETVELRGPDHRGCLTHHLEHRTLDNMTVFLNKMNKYTTLEAEQLRQDGREPRLSSLLWTPFWIFTKLYFLKLGFRDGLEGFMFCMMSGVSAAVRQWKLRELTQAEPRRAGTQLVEEPDRPKPLANPS